MHWETVEEYRKGNYHRKMSRSSYQGQTVYRYITQIGRRPAFGGYMAGSNSRVFSSEYGLRKFIDGGQTNGFRG